MQNDFDILHHLILTSGGCGSHHYFQLTNEKPSLKEIKRNVSRFTQVVDGAAAQASAVKAGSLYLTPWGAFSTTDLFLATSTVPATMATQYLLVG